MSGGKSQLDKGMKSIFSRPAATTKLAVSATKQETGKEERIKIWLPWSRHTEEAWSGAPLKVNLRT